MILELLAPAKLNLALEITGRRADGYHDLVSVMQTIDLCDRVRVADAQHLELDVGGQELRGVPREGPRNLAFAAAQALAAAASDKGLGARIELEKHIPAGMGLGGGSSDAAAVLRGLNALWRLGFGEPELCEVGARVGSDVPFFIIGGAALVTGRGEHVASLPDGEPMALTMFVSEAELQDKTRRMYGLIDRADYSDGRKAYVLAESLRRGLPLSSSDFVNAFDPHVGDVVEQVGRAMALCRESGIPVFACGSGPGFFSPLDAISLPPMLGRELEHEWGVRMLPCRTLGRDEALAVREV